LEAQLSGAQAVPLAYSWQLPLPSHLPLLPQPGAPESLHIWRTSIPPAGTIVHLPSEPGRLQLRQAPVQAFSQQMPSTHWLDLQSLACLQVWPFCFGPQLFFTQLMPVSQSASLLQYPRQAPAEQANGEQFCRAGARQVPRPSQMAAMFSLFPAQLGIAQTVPAGASWHPPTPSHRPVSPHG
jgi:hypothetical protein